MSLTDDQLREILSTSHRIAVVGMSPNPGRPSHGVSRYLRDVGYQIIPIRPDVRHVLEEPAFPDLITAARKVWNRGARLALFLLMIHRLHLRTIRCVLSSLLLPFAASSQS